MAGEQGEEPRDPFAADTVRLRRQAVEISLLLGNGLFGGWLIRSARAGSGVPRSTVASCASSREQTEFEGG